MAEIIFTTPSQDAARNNSGQTFANAFLSAFNRGVDQRREDQRWNELAPLREAQLTQANAQAQSAASRAQIEAIQAANMAKQQAGIVEFAGLQGDIATRGYDPADRVRLYEFLKKNPEFYGSQFHQQLEGGFNNAAKARADEEEWRTRIGADIAQERIRDEARQVTRPGLTEDQRIVLRGKIAALKGDPRAAVPGWLDTEIGKVATEYGISPPEAIHESSTATESLAAPVETKTNKAPEVQKWIRDSSGKPVLMGSEPIPDKPKPEKRDSGFIGNAWIGQGVMPSRTLR